MKSKNFYREHKLVANLLIMLGISVIIVLMMARMTHYISFHGEEYDLPDFVGYDTQAIEKYKKEGNKYEFEFVISDSVFIPDKKGGEVLAQDPPSGSKVKRGRKVYLSVVALSIPTVEMPNLVDLSLRQAENMLQSNDLKIKQVIYKASRFPHAVLEQRYLGRVIEPGQFIPYHSEITLIVGKEAMTGEAYEDEE